MSKLCSPVTWVGGKSRLLPHILPLVQPVAGESLFVDACGGSGVVLINKEPHPSETYNDIDGDLVNLFRVIRDPDGVVHLWWELMNTPVAREEFGTSLKAAKEPFSPLTPVQRAASFVVRCRQRFGGGCPGPDRQDTDRAWGTTRQSSRGMNESVSRWLSIMLQLPEVHRRFTTVVIDQQDVLRCIQQWDTPCTLFYADPPYVGAEGFYKGGLDHGELAEALNRIKGRVVLSYYACALVEKLYPESRWHSKRVKTFATTCGNAPRDPNSKNVKKLGAVRERTELILTNFDPKTRARLAG